MPDTPRIRPAISPEQGLEIARRHYGISATEAHPLPSDRDQNLLLVDEDSDRRYVLKLAHSGEEPEVLDFQNRILEHLARAGFPSSSPLFAQEGREIVETRGPEGVAFLTRLLPWLPGEPLHRVRPLTPDLLHAVGSFLGAMDRALEDFSHSAQDRDLDWNLKEAGQVIEAHAGWVEDPANREFLVETASRFLDRLEPLAPRLRQSVIHGDANDHNILVAPLAAGEGPEHRSVAGILDLGDSVRSFTVADPAIACAYAMLGQQDPVSLACRLVAGYHRALPLSEEEVAALVPLLGLRLCVSVVMSARQKSNEPENEYLTVSERPAWALLNDLRRMNLELFHVRLRDACGMEPVLNRGPVVEWLSQRGSTAAPVLRIAAPALPTTTPDHSEATPVARRATPALRGAIRSATLESATDAVPLSQLPLHILDLGVDSWEFPLAPDPLDAAGWTDRIFRRMKEAGATVGVGRYGEVRTWYTSANFREPGDDASEARTVHMGIDLFVNAETEVCSPFDAVVRSVAENAGDLDYGPTVILEHRVETGDLRKVRFWTLYGHLSREVLGRLTPGANVKRGEAFARVGSFPTNGNWAPHLHVQIITELLGFTGDFPGVALPSQLEIWKALSPDPNLILGIPDVSSPDEGSPEARSPLKGLTPGDMTGYREFLTRKASASEPSGATLTPRAGRNSDEILQTRRTHLGPNLSVSYSTPLKILRGQAQFLFDQQGQAYLDCVNNVPHVGHCHPRVVEAGRAQMALLNTNTRYLHDVLVEYAERLVAKLPDPLSVVYFVCTGSEANELALRMARVHTGQKDVLVLEGAYHGNTSALVDMSPYKFRGQGGEGRKDWVHPALMPDPYRGHFRASGLEQEGPDDGQGPFGRRGGSRKGGRHDAPLYLVPEDLGRAYADDLTWCIEDLERATGRTPAAFFCETLLGCGGQIVPPSDYLTHAYQTVRDAGAVCVADEVQVGFGRAGSHFWAFETQDVVPDIVTLGKPIANGHPMAAVVTTPAIAESFATGMEYFNTFGGNPVSCAIGLAVLDVIEEEGLQENARVVGADLLQGLRALKERHPIIGDVRGVGLFLGVELVEDPTTREPARARASRVKERLRDHRILVSTDGPDENVLKIKPPLVFSGNDGLRLVATLDRILGEDGIRR